MEAFRKRIGRKKAQKPQKDEFEIPDSQNPLLRVLRLLAAISNLLSLKISLADHVRGFETTSLHTGCHDDRADTARL
ncbi:MAG TPA: hypothetical protein VM165_20860 [Planctomycetaceae bacterium]|nr:hypothetical protein [Planctomycetaceae bacterium]